MSVDLYAVCPCGSGKKIKFCKCKDSVHQLDEVLQMIEGGQVVPALDRMNSILDENPQAAWVLAIRGRLLLDLREYNSLAENAERFIRLQPANPLALTQAAAAKLFAGEMEAATEGVLEALTESGQDVDSFVLDVASVLAYSLSQAGNYLTARVYATLGLVASEYEGGATAMTVLRSINSSPMVNGFLKQIPDSAPRPSGVEWAERFDEAQVLLRNNKVTLAENKFDNLRRTVSGSPAILGGLLTCAIWRGDLAAQGQLLQRLSECDSLDHAERIRYRAMAAVINPVDPELAVGSVQLTAEIENVDELTMAMGANSGFVDLPAESLQQFRVNEDDVPPKAAFQIADREVPTIEDGAMPAIKDIPESLGTVVVYGKQTDRSARIEVMDVREDQADAARQKLTEIDGGIDWKSEPATPIPLLMLAEPNVVALRLKAQPGDVQTMQQTLFTERSADSLTGASLKILGGKSIADAAGDEALKLPLAATVAALEQYDAIAGRDQAVIDKLYATAGLEKPPMIQPTVEQIETIENFDLIRIDPSGMDVESMVYLLRRAQQVSSSGAAARLADALLKADLKEGEEEAKVVAYMAAIGTSREPTEALRLADEAREFAEKNNIDHPPIYFAQMNLSLAAGQPEVFQTAVQTIATKYQNNPEVMAQLQQLLVRYGLIRPDGSPRNGPAPGGPMGGGAMGGGGPAGGGGLPPSAPQGGGGGLWTPDQGSPQGGGGGGGGGSKIILPGG